MTDNVWKTAMEAMQKSLLRMKEENETLKQEKTQYQQVNTKLGEENDELREKAFQGERQGPRDESLIIDDLKQTIETLKTQNEGFKEGSSVDPEGSAELRRLKESVSDLTAENEILRKKLLEKSAAVRNEEDGEENHALLETYQTTIGKLQAENKQMSREIHILVGKFRKAETSRVQFMNENELMKEEMKSMSESVKKAESERDKLRQMLQDVSRMHSMKGDDKDAQVKRLEEKVQSLDNVIIKTSTDVKEKAQKIERLMTTIDELRNDLQVSEREKELLRKDVKDKEDRVESLRKGVQRAVEDKEDLIRSLDGDKQKEAHTLDRLMAQLEKATEEKEGYKKQKEDLESKKLELESRLNVEREELQRAEQERENLRRERVELQKRMAKLEDEGAERKSDIEKLTRDNESLMSENTKLSARVDSLKKENNKLNAELDEMSDEIAILKQRRGDMNKKQEQTERYEDENRELRSKVADLTTKLESTDDAAKMYKDSSREKAKQLAKMKEQFSGSGAELSKLKVKLELLENKHVKLEEENEELVELAKEKTRQNQECKSEVSKMQLQNLMLMKELNVASQMAPMLDINGLGDGGDAKTKELLNQIKKLKDENKRLRATLTMKEMTEANCISEITELQEELSKQSNQLKQAENKLKKKQEWADDVLYDKVKNKPGKSIEKYSSLSLPNIQRAAMVSSPVTSRSFVSDSKLGPRSRMQGGYMKNFKKR